MYRDTEQDYKGWTLDVFQSVQDDAWICDYWNRYGPEKGSVRGQRRREVIAEAQAAIDRVMDAGQVAR